MDTFLGVSYFNWGLLCIVIAILYVFIKPRERNPQAAKHRSPWRKIILRWFHPLVWLFLASTSFFRAVTPPLSPIFMGITGMFALGTYLAYIYTYFSENRRK